MSVIVNFISPVAEEIKQSKQVRMRLISQLSKDISRFLQKILKYFNSTSISTSFVLPSASFFSVVAL